MGNIICLLKQERGFAFWANVS